MVLVLRDSNQALEVLDETRTGFLAPPRTSQGVRRETSIVARSRRQVVLGGAALSQGEGAY